MTLAALTPTLVTLDEAQAYLRDKGVRDGNADIVQTLLNAVTGELYKLSGRRKILNDNLWINEYRQGDGSTTILTHEAPIVDVSQVVLHPHNASLTRTLTGPATAVSNANMMVDQALGKIVLKDFVFPDSQLAVQIDYKAGGATTDPEVQAARAVILELLQSHWQKFVDSEGNLSSRSAGDQEWVFRSTDQQRRDFLRKIRPFRRWWFA